MHIEVPGPNATNLHWDARPDSTESPSSGGRPAESELGPVNDSLPRQAGLDINTLSLVIYRRWRWHALWGFDDFMVACVYLQCV